MNFLHSFKFNDYHKKITLVIIAISWFVPTGIGFNFMGTPIDVTKFLTLFLIIIFFYTKTKLSLNIIDKLFILFIFSQLIFSIFYIDFFKQFLYLIYYIIFYYSYYFFARLLFQDSDLFDYFIITLSKIIIIILPFLIVIHVFQIYDIVDAIRIAYPEDTLAYAHTYIRVMGNINLGNSFVGNFLNPNTMTQLLGMLFVFLFPYYLWKLNKKNVLLFSFTLLILVIGLLMTQSRSAVIIILMEFVLLLVIQYQNIYKVSIISLGIIFFIYIIDKEVLIYYFYLLIKLQTYIEQSNIVLCNNMFDETLCLNRRDRIYFYQSYFKYIFDSLVNLIFGYGAIMYKFKSNVIGITDLAAPFYTFMRVGIISFLLYIIFYISILKKIVVIYNNPFKECKRLAKYISVVLLSISIVFIQGYQAILNPIYFFIIGSLVVLIDNCMRNRKVLNG